MSSFTSINYTWKLTIMSKKKFLPDVFKDKGIIIKSLSIKMHYSLTHTASKSYFGVTKINGF